MTGVQFALSGSSFCFVLILLFNESRSDAQTVEWIDQYLTGVNHSVSADGLGNIYSAGGSGDAFFGTDNLLVTKHDSGGNRLWTRGVGSGRATGISADRIGNVFVTGLTAGSLSGPSVGGSDAFIRAYDAAGSVLWTDQFGTNADDFGTGVVADGSGHVYVSGYTSGNLGGSNAGLSDCFLTKYNSDGMVLWTRQFGTTSDDEASAVTVDGMGSIYVAGHTRGSLGGPAAGQEDAFLAKYDSAGFLQWTHQLGTTSAEVVGGVSTDDLGNIYIAGSTEGSLGDTIAGSNDIFVSKFNSSGTLQWTTQLGTSQAEHAFAISSDGSGHVYVSGSTAFDLFEPNTLGFGQAFVAKLTNTGSIVWGRQFGNMLEFDGAQGVSADGLGNVYFSGYFGENAGPDGIFHPFVGKIRDIPEPCTIGLLAVSVFCLSCIKRVA